MSRRRPAPLLALACALAAACAAPNRPDVLAGEPYVTGPVESITPRAGSALLLVRAGPGSREPCGISATVDAKSAYLRRDRSGAVSKTTLAELAVGDTVEVYVTGPVAESCPVQGYAAAVVVVEGGA